MFTSDGFEKGKGNWRLQAAPRSQKDPSVLKIRQGDIMVLLHSQMPLFYVLRNMRSEVETCDHDKITENKNTTSVVVTLRLNIGVGHEKH